MTPTKRDQAIAEAAAGRDIAVIGMAGRFPGARNLEELRSRLAEGADGVGPISPQRIADTALSPDADYLVAGYLDDIDKFDHQLFGMSLGEAAAMGPNLRIALEVAFEAFENSGYGPDYFRESDTAVYASQSSSSYYEHADELIPTLITGNSPDFFATRISRQFDLNGPAMMVDTACSSSLAALHLACQALWAGDARHALVCGSNVHVFPMKGNAGKLLDVWSPDGRSRAFSARAEGMSVGEMVAVILLKPLEQALRDRDNVHAIIKATAINNNARRSSSPSAPDALMQAQVIRTAWERAKLDPTTLGFIEAHGSGTKLGDSLEVEALSLAFRSYTERTGLCPISTIKANIGHTHAAAGLAGLLKAILSLKHREVFPALHFDEPSPLIDFSKSAVYVNKKLQEFPSVGGAPRRAAVHAFGMSGVNAHAVLEEAPARERLVAEESEPARMELVTLSARTPDGLRRAAESLHRHLDARPATSLADIAVTLNTGRTHFSSRAALVGRTTDEIQRKLATIAAGSESCTVSKAAKLVFVFSPCAESSQSMLDDLAARHPAFRSAVRECTESFEASREALDFVFQYAMHRTLVAYGIRPATQLAIGRGKHVNRAISGTDLVQSQQAWLSEDVREPSEWRKRLETLLNDLSSHGGAAFVEMGIGGLLATEGRELILGGRGCALVAPSPGSNDAVLELLASLYVAGECPDWTRLHAQGSGTRIELPGYSFDRARCWLRDTPKAGVRAGAGPWIDSGSTSRRFEPSRASNDTETALAGFWAEVVGHSDFDNDTPFFDCGGNSIGATKVIRKINAEFSLRLDFEDAFDFPTLRALAAHVRAQMGTEGLVAHCWKDVLKVDAVNPDDDFFRLGGHSLLANQVLSRVRRELNVAMNFEEFFRHPTLSAFTRRIEELTRGSVVDEAGAIPRLPPASDYELSPAQKHLWVLSQFEGASAAYNVAVYDILHGALDRRAFEAAVDALVVRHESLRTHFVTVDDEPRQRILSPERVGPVVRYSDLSTLESPEKDAVALINEECSRPFDLSAAPLIRALLVKLGDDKHVLCFTVHHIVCDAWSFDVMLNEVFLLYEANRTNREGPLEPLRIQYKDYAAAVNAELAGPAMQAHVRYWKDKLAGPLSPLDIEGDGPRPPLKTFRGGLLRHAIEPSVREALRSTCERYHATPFMALLSVVEVLLHRYSGSTDLIVGTPMAGRGRPELEGQVGLYMNLVPLRTRVDPLLSFVDMLSSVKKTVIEAQEHQELPFDIIVREVKPVRDMSRSVLVDVIVIMQNAGLRTRKNERDLGVRVEELHAEHAVSRYDLTFEFAEVPEGLVLEIEYNADVYRPERVARMAAHVSAVAARLFADPEGTIGNVQLESERSAVVEPVRATTNMGLHGLVATQCARTPDAVALVCGDARLTYRELQNKSESLAALLQRKGVAQEDRVMVCMDGAIELPIAILGILEAGASFVPVDPSFPPSRLAAMANACQAKVVLLGTDPSRAFDGCPCEILAASEWLSADSISGQRRAVDFFSEGLAYTIFTSGSTGIPKGVEVTHRSVVALLEAMADQPGMRAGDVLVAVTTPAFDISILEMFLPLIRGATLVFPAEQRGSDPDRLRDAIARNQPTVMQATPSTWKVVTERGWDGVLPRKILCGGEALPLELVETLTESGRELWNLYGPTETTIWSLVQRMLPDDPRVSIGAPIAGTSACLLDASLHMRPPGFSGDLYIGGAGLARGYLDAPGLTAEAFIPDPHTFARGARMYRTGDVAVCPSEGNRFEFRGRRDSQVKVRGFRIELGEIEAALARHPFVESAAVTLSLSGEARDGIVGYVVPRPQRAPSVSELKEFLRNGLPEYMVPSTFVLLEALPLNANGKVDRVRLSRTAPTRPALPQMFRPPTGEVEKIIASVWQQLLGIEVGRNDNFFDLGGHSLMLVKAHARLEGALERTFPLVLLFQYPTVIKLATRLEGGDGSAAQMAVTARERGKMQKEAIRRQRAKMERKGSPHDAS
jgi:amino acid adenylation domain-containing protein